MKQAYLSAVFQDLTGQYGIRGAWHHGMQKYPGINWTHPDGVSPAPQINVSPQGVVDTTPLVIVVDVPDTLIFVGDPFLVATTIATTIVVTP